MVETMGHTVRLAAIFLGRWTQWFVATWELANALGKSIWIDWRDDPSALSVFERHAVWIAAVHRWFCAFVEIPSCGTPIFALLHACHAVVAETIGADEFLVDWPLTPFASHVVLGAWNTTSFFDDTQFWYFVVTR